MDYSNDERMPPSLAVQSGAWRRLIGDGRWVFQLLRAVAAVLILVAIYLTYRRLGYHRHRLSSE